MRKKFINPIKRFLSKVNTYLCKGFSKFLDLFYRTYVGIDITTYEVRVLTFKRNSIRKWSSVPIANDLIKDGIILEPQTLGLTLDNLFTTMKLPRRRVICTITGMPFVYRIINMPYTGNTINKEAIERAARKEMSLSETDMYLYWQATETHTQVKERDFLVFGIPRHAVLHLVEALSKAKIKRYMLDIKPLALGRATSLKDVILVSLERGYVDIVVVVDSIIRVMHGFTPTRNEDIQYGISREILNGLGSAVKSFNRDFPKMPLSTNVPVMLSGELMNDIEIINYLKENSGHPVSNIKLHSITLLNIPLAQFSTALGLIYKTIPEKAMTTEISEYKDINIDFFSSLKKPLAERFKPSYALTTLTIIALAALVYFSYTFYHKVSVKIDSLDIEYATTTLLLNKAKKANTEALTLKNEESNNYQNLQKHLEALKAEQLYIAGLQREYTDEIMFIISVLPSKCQYTQITMNTNGYTVSGEADSLYEVLGYADSLENDSEFQALIKSVQPLTIDRVQFELNISTR